LPGLFPAAGIETVQAGMQDVRLLPVLLGLLLMPLAAAALLLMRRMTLKFPGRL
jgi:hypothetical protein